MQWDELHIIDFSLSRSQLPVEQNLRVVVREESQLPMYFTWLLPADIPANRIFLILIRFHPQILSDRVSIIMNLGRETLNGYIKRSTP